MTRNVSLNGLIQLSNLLMEYILDLQIENGGCTNWGSDTQAGVRVQDARKLRQYLTTKLLLNAQLSDGSKDIRREFLAGLEEAIQDDSVLRHTLLPMVSKVNKGLPTDTLSRCFQDCELNLSSTKSQEASVSGDSFMRVLLTVEPIQTAVAEFLLLKLTDEGLQSQRIDRLILSQFRWYVWPVRHAFVAGLHLSLWY